MGDRCYLHFELLPCHVGVVGKILKACNKLMSDEKVWWDELQEYDHMPEHARIHEFIIDEANYGWMDEFEKIALAGIPFTGTHYGGSEYGPEVFACYNKKLIYINADKDGNPTLSPVFGKEIDDVSIDSKDLNRIINYRRLEHNFSQLRNNIWEIIDKFNKTKEEHMGQYHIIVNKTKKQFLNPHMFNDVFNDGIELAGLAVLLAEDNGEGEGDLSTENPIVGTWAGDDIVIAGDYGDPVRDGEENLYDLCHTAYSGYENISLKVVDAMTDSHYIMEGFLESVKEEGMASNELARFIKAKAVRLRLINK